MAVEVEVRLQRPLAVASLVTHVELLLATQIVDEVLDIDLEGEGGVVHDGTRFTLSLGDAAVIEGLAVWTQGVGDDESLEGLWLTLSAAPLRGSASLLLLALVAAEAARESDGGVLDEDELLGFGRTPDAEFVLAHLRERLRERGFQRCAEEMFGGGSVT